VDDLSIAPERPVPVDPARGADPSVPTGPPLPPPGGPLVTLAAPDPERPRVTVLFRAFMAIPHLLWLGTWGSAMVLLAPVLWIVALFTGSVPAGLHELYAMFVRYCLHAYAFLYLASERFPGFLGRPRSYTVDVDVPEPARHNRWTVALRFVLALPPLTLSTTMLGGGLSASSAGGASVGTATSVVFLAWFACLVKGRMPQGFRDLIIWCLGYTVQVYGYLFLLTPRYPNSDPAVAPLAPLPAHPVRLRMTDELRRHRLLVFFRYVLAFPHVLWQLLWSLVAFPVAIVAWFAALATGRTPSPLHRFLAAFVRYSTHVYAFANLGGGLFPGFAGRAGSYPVDVEIDPPQRQNRWKTLFRLVLVFPALIVAGAVSSVMFTAAVGAWFFALFMGRVPEGLRNVIVFSCRYVAQVSAYLLLLTDRYPYSGPADFRRELAA
jgi:hypothetical protein